MKRISVTMEDISALADFPKLPEGAEFAVYVHFNGDGRRIMAPGGYTINTIWSYAADKLNNGAQKVEIVYEQGL